MGMAAHYFNGRVRLYHADAYQAVKTFADYNSDLHMVTDPPYLIDTSGGGAYRKARKTMEDLEDAEITDGFDLDILSCKLARSIVVFCHNDQLCDVMVRLKQGFTRVVVCAWHKTNPQPHANRHYQADTEFIVHAWNKGSKHYPRGALNDKTRYIIEPRIAHDLKKELGGHPSIKPLAVMDKIITNVAPGVIIDPFMGTGSTGVAALAQGREFIGIETKQKWYEVACARFEALQDQLGANFGRP